MWKSMEYQGPTVNESSGNKLTMNEGFAQESFFLV